jgi:hypothetical protein
MRANGHEAKIVSRSFAKAPKNQSLNGVKAKSNLREAMKALRGRTTPSATWTHLLLYGDITDYYSEIRTLRINTLMLAGCRICGCSYIK